MPRKSKRKQNKKKYHKRNPCKKAKFVLEKHSLSNNSVDTRLNVQEHLLSKVQNFSHNNCLYRIDSDSDPDIFFEFHPDIILKKAKSDSVLNKFTDNGTFVSFEFKSTTRCLNIEQMDHQISVDSCRNTLSDTISTSCSVNSFDETIENIHKEEFYCQDIILQKSRETENSEKQKSYTNVHKKMNSTLSDEALESDITSITSRSLISGTNVITSNCVMSRPCRKTFSEIKTIFNAPPEACSRICSSPFLQFEKTEDQESKIYMEKTKSEKQFLNCSILNDEPRGKSTPISGKNKLKCHDEQNFFVSLTTGLEASSDEYYSCCIECNDNNNECEEAVSCLEPFISKNNIDCKERMKCLEVVPFESSISDYLVSRTKFKNASVQCELLKSETQSVSETKQQPLSTNNYEYPCALNSSSKNKASCKNETKYFESLKKILSRISVQRIIHVLSAMPIDKLLEFICLTFSVPIIETMAISISVTKIMNILSSATLIFNFHEQLKKYSSKTLCCMKSYWENFGNFFSCSSKEISLDPKKEVRHCFCDIQRITDLEKRLKNLENELTKFQLVEEEIEKLKKISISSHQDTVLEVKLGLPPPPPPPPLPPPPPPPPPLSLLHVPCSSANTCTKSKKKLQSQDSLTRPSITVEDLQKVILRKVPINEKQVQDSKKGPLVSLEMLRSVKLRSSVRKKTPTCSPTRTPTSRERLRRIKSPFRSGSRSRECKSRYPSIPLSEILGLDESYQVFEQKN